MNDLISRQAAIDTLHMDTSIIPYKKAREYADATILEIRNRLEKLPSAQPEQRWIPCSERLPKPFEHCLWTTTDGRVVYHHCDGLFSNYTAWMPLPGPYMERRTDE